LNFFELFFELLGGGLEPNNQPGGPASFPPAGSLEATLAEQLRNRLEERRKSKDDDVTTASMTAAAQSLPVHPPPAPPTTTTSAASFVPEAMAADIQKAVKMANDNSKLIVQKITSLTLLPGRRWESNEMVPKIGFGRPSY
jgi:hypothetical protein